MNALVRRWIHFGAAAVAVGFTSAADAQPEAQAPAPAGVGAETTDVQAAPAPDPFADYQSWKSEGAAGPPPAAARSLPAETATVEQARGGVPPETNGGVTVPTARGTWLIGATASFGYTGTSSDQLAGGSRSDKTFFVHAAPSVGYLLRDRLVLGGSFGPLIKSVSRENDLTATESAWLLEANAFYIVPLVPRFAFVPGIGIGGYLGSSERGLRLTEGTVSRDVVESTSTRGLSATLHLGVAYQVAANWQLRTGLRIQALLGSETVASADKTLASSSAHVALPVELYYTFR